MTVQISSLRVTPELDASKYTSGAQEKVAADKAMAASSITAGQAVAATDTKISAAGDVLARLSRQYEQGYAAQQKFSQGLGQLSRGLESGKINIEGAERILVGMNAKLGLLGDASEIAAKGQVQLAAAVRAANAQIAGQVLAAENASAAARRLQSANLNARPTNNFASLNATNQFQDIAITAAMGQSIPTIALQQGTQLGMAMQMSAGAQGATGAVKMLGAAITGLFTPVNLAAIGITAAAAATIQWFMKGKEGAESLDKALQAQRKSIIALGEAYGIAGLKADDFNSRSILAAESAARREDAALKKSLDAAEKDALNQLGNPFTIGRGRKTYFGPKPEFSEFGAAISILNSQMERGVPNFHEFYNSIDRVVANNPGLQTTRDKIMDIVDAAAKAAEQLEKTSGFIKDISRSQLLGPGAMDRKQNAGREELERRRRNGDDPFANIRIDPAADHAGIMQRREAATAQLQGIMAHSPAERQAAAQAAAAAQYIKGESDIARADRIDIAGKIALVGATKSLSDARKDRARSIDQTIASQQLDFELIGKTAGVAAKMRFEFERIQALREDAARNGVAVDEKELALIKAKAEEYSKYADAIARAKLDNDLSFERSQQFLDKNEQAIALRLRGTGIGINSPEAQQMRDMTKFGEAKDLASGFLTDFKSELISSGGNIGKALGQSILNAATNAMDKAWSKIFDQLATAFASALTGQSAGGGAFGTAGGFAQMLMGVANDNYAPGAVTRAPHGPIGGGSVAEQSWNFFKSKGLADHQVAGILGNIKAESAFNPNAIGDAGKAFGLFQHHSARGGGQGLLSSGVMGQLNHAWDELNSSESGVLSRLRGSTDVRGSTAAFAGFERPRGFSFANPEGSDNFSGRLSGANAALEKFGGSTANASKGLNAFGGGLGKMGSALSQFPSAPSLGGGGGGILKSLFGGLSSAFAGSSAFNWLSANPGGYVGLYADGTENAPPGWAWVGERGPELKKLRAGDVIRSNPRSMQMVAANGNGSSSSPSKIELHVTVIGGSGDDHVRKLAQQGAQEAIGQYNEAQQRGGFGEMQRRYASQKG